MTYDLHLKPPWNQNTRRRKRYIWFDKLFKSRKIRTKCGLLWKNLWYILGLGFSLQGHNCHLPFSFKAKTQVQKTTIDNQVGFRFSWVTLCIFSVLINDIIIIITITQKVLKVRKREGRQMKRIIQSDIIIITLYVRLCVSVT